MHGGGTVPNLRNRQATYGKNDCQLSVAANGATSRTPFAHTGATTTSGEDFTTQPAKGPYHVTTKPMWLIQPKIFGMSIEILTAEAPS